MSHLQDKSFKVALRKICKHIGGNYLSTAPITTKTTSHTAWNTPSCYHDWEYKHDTSFPMTTNSIYYSQRMSNDRNDPGVYVKVKFTYSISQEICTRFLLCCALLCLYIDWFPISSRLTSLALWQSNDCPSASKATLMNMDKYFMWIHYERLHNHNNAKHNKAVCIFLGIYCIM